MQITLRAARVNAGLTLKQAEEKTGFNEASIRDWEKCRHEPRLSALRKLCKAYGIKPEQVDLSAWD